MAAFIKALSVRTVIRPLRVRMAGIRVTVVLPIAPAVVRIVRSVIVGIVIRRTKEVLRFSQSLLQDRADRFVFCEWHGDPAVVVVNAGPLSRFQSSWVDVHQRLLVGNHLVQLLKFSLLPRQLSVNNSFSPGRARLPPPPVSVLALSAGLAPLPGGHVPAPFPASAATPAGAPAPAATLRLAPDSSVRPLSAPFGPAALVLNAWTSPLLNNASKLVPGRAPALTPDPAVTPASTATPASAATVFTPTDAVVLSEVLHHRLHLVCLLFLLPGWLEIVTQVISGIIQKF